VYLIGADGVIISRVDLGYEDEEIAKKRAKLLVDGHDVIYGTARGRSRSSTLPSRSLGTCLAGINGHRNVFIRRA